MGPRFTLSPSCLFKVRVVAVCLCWYVISSASSITNKVLLQTYPYPMTLALSNLMWVPIYCAPLLRIYEYKVVKLTSVQYNKYLTPISIGKALAVVSAYVSLWKVPVSYAHTVKASMPLFAVFLSRVLLKETQSYRVYVSLLPIVAGVIVASATELSFSFLGMFSALFSTFTYSLLNILVKKLLKESDIHPIRLLAMNSQLAAIMVFPFWLLNDAFTMTRSFGSEDVTSGAPDMWLLCLLAMTGVLSFLQSLCAFALIHQLTALSYAVCNATKRITVIGSSLFTLHNPVTGTNVFGMMLSVFGVFCYNRAKQSEKDMSHSLPLTRSHTVASATLVEMDPGQTSDLMYWSSNWDVRLFRPNFCRNCCSVVIKMEQCQVDKDEHFWHILLSAFNQGSSAAKALQSWASTNRNGINGSRLGDFEYTDTYQNRFDKMDDISKEQHSRRHVRFA